MANEYDDGYDIDMDFMGEARKMRPTEADLKREHDAKAAREAAIRKQEDQKRHAQRNRPQQQGRPGNNNNSNPAGGGASPVQPTDNANRGSVNPDASANMSNQVIQRDEDPGMGQDHDNETPGVDTATAVADTPSTMEPESISDQTKDSDASQDFVHDDEQSIDWRRFKTLPRLYEHVGGYRPVQLVKDVKKVTVSGTVEPLFDELQKQLKLRYQGAQVHFPWGTHNIDEKNRVFTTKSSLVRYLMYDGLRDGDGTHVQYAKQWFAFAYPTAFDANFRPDIHIKPADDSLDIYVLLYIAHQSDIADGRYDDRSISASDELTGHQIETLEQVELLNTSMTRAIGMLKHQELEMRKQADRSQMMQTLLLLDRMGLLKGGVPRDVEGLARLLETSRDVLNDTETAVDKHIEAERSRQSNYDSTAQKRELNNW